MNIVCLGDSNTWGYDPRSYLGGRYPKEHIWTELLAEKTGHSILNAGLNGREIRNLKWRIPDNTDFLIIMLGTNDLLQGNSAETVTAYMKQFLESLPLFPEKVLLVSPPPLQIGEWVQSPATILESQQLREKYQLLADQLGLLFTDASLWNIPLCFDGVHFTEEGHKLFLYNITTTISRYLSTIG